MKHYTYTLICALALVAAAVSCMKIDNFAEPDARVSGTIIDKTTGKPMLLDHAANHIRIWEMSYSENPTPQDLAIKEDGTYNNTKLFAGTYDMLARDGAWWPCDTVYNVAIGRKGAVQDFEVTPYLHIVDFTAELQGTDIVFSCKLQAPVTENLPQIREIRPFLNTNIHCGPANHIDAYYTDTYRINLRKMWAAIGDASGNQTVDAYTVTVPVKAGYTYWVRMGAQLNDTYTSWNLSEVKKIVVPE